MRAYKNIDGEFIEIDNDDIQTRRDKAFWQVYSAMLGDWGAIKHNPDDVAAAAMMFVDAGLKALEAEK